jgi:Zn-dependent M28 family amino/carboxypeptidase
MKNLFLFYFLAAFVVADAQKLKKEDRQLLANLQKHITYLASDSLEGRRTGTPGEQKAMAYISTEFRNVGLEPKGTSEYYQSFQIDEGKQIDPSTHLTVGGQSLLLQKEFLPLVFSANASLEALPSMAIQEVDMPWFWDVKEVLEANAQNPHYNIYDTLKAKAKEAGERGATALFVYNTSSAKDGIAFNGRDKSETASIPVVYLTKEGVRKYFNDPGATLDVKLKTEIAEKKRSGSNVVGYIDNKAATTVVIGAHFDHLGYGEDGNSIERNGKYVHNGADDNASGVAAMIELARMLKASDLKQNNYLFIAFSGEELGLYGSKYFVAHPTIDFNSVNYMINMDMIGRLNEANQTLTVGGFGTSPSWGLAYAQTGRRGLYNNSLKFKFDSSGTGPSDHTSFYLKQVPVLFYFTGLHTDYHKPTDDFDRINYNGQLAVVKHIYSVIESQNKQANKLAFTKTREMQSSTTASFSVTLGIMPDYSFGGAGVRVDAVSQNRPAEKIGMKAGDVIVQLGDHNVSSLEQYMQALGKFKKGDKTTVHYMRGTEKLSAPVEF